MATIAQIGDPLNRFDGVEKVTGAARYAAEHPADGLLHGFAISSAIAKGRIKEIDTSAALAVPGIVEVITHLNRPSVAWLDSKYDDDAAPPGSPLRPIYDDRIHFSGQPIALVIAETPELARYGASLIAVSYEEEPFNTDFSKALDERFSPRKARSHRITRPIAAIRREHSTRLPSRFLATTGSPRNFTIRWKCMLPRRSGSLTAN